MESAFHEARRILNLLISSQPVQCSFSLLYFFSFFFTRLNPFWFRFGFTTIFLCISKCLSISIVLALNGCSLKTTRKLTKKNLFLIRLIIILHNYPLLLSKLFVCVCVCVLWIGLFEPNYLDREKSRVESNDQFASVPYCLRENVYASVCICLS